ncbi:hypothetical protein SNE40_018631 [Patella caerulea]|uniref:Uncharacterized protein n=1 Tax=Patella caerulea TaxID=87958 RepID=A0AAN8J5H5_PATCE
MTTCLGSHIIMDCQRDRENSSSHFVKNQQLFQENQLDSNSSPTMQTVSRRYQDSSQDAKDTFAVKGLIALAMCIVYACILFCIAAIVSTVFTVVKNSASSVCLMVWETESTKTIEVPRTLRNPTRYGQK